jgi:hypothetical protein
MCNTTQCDYLKTTNTLNRLAMPYIKWLVTAVSLQRPGFDPRVFEVAFFMDRLALGHVLLQALQLSFYQMPHTDVYHRLVQQAAVLWGSGSPHICR